jgi:hypothetical protein
MAALEGMTVDALTDHGLRKMKDASAVSQDPMKMQHPGNQIEDYE